jgi:hypothetical protein
MEGAMAVQPLAVSFQVNAASLYKRRNINAALDGVDPFLFYHLFSSLVGQTTYLAIDSTIPVS